MRRHLSKTLLTLMGGVMLLSAPAIAQNQGMQNGQQQKKMNKSQQEDMRKQSQQQQQDKEVLVKSDTAGAMIGQKIRDEQGENIGSVEDIIISREGGAMHSVIRHNGYWGFGGELVAVDFQTFRENQVTSLDGDLDVLTIIMPEQQIQKAERFEYEKTAGAQDQNILVMPKDAISVAKLLGENLVGPENEEIAEIADLAFRDGQAARVVLMIENMLGLKDRLIAMNYDTMQFSMQEDTVQPMLNQTDAQKLEAFKSQMMQKQETPAN